MSNIKTPSLGHTLSALAFIIAPPQLTVSGITAFLIGLVHPAGVIEDTKTIWGFIHTAGIGESLLIIIHVILITFPLALAAAAIMAMAIEKELGFWNCIGVIIVAGIVSNVLGLIIPSVSASSPDMWKLFKESTATIKGPLLFAVYAYKVVAIWWENLTVFPFIQSVALGAYLGYKFAKK